MMGDVTIAEPGAYIGFAGRRVIEQTMRQKLPQDAATAEFLLQHGMIDMVTQRAEIPGVLSRLIKIYTASPAAKERELVGQPA
jgi:acetyl-CoA carboxylase carboxyl transferase subunit beta